MYRMVWTAPWLGLRVLSESPTAYTGDATQCPETLCVHLSALLFSSSSSSYKW